MNPIVQSGMHPDADTLTAFAEQLLPSNERDQVLAHMAVCSRCREVVFLTQQAATSEPLTLPVSASARKDKAHGPWLGGWRWAWIPAGGLVALIGIVAVLHFRRLETETLTARNSVSTEALKQPLPAPAMSTLQTPAAPPKTAERPKPHVAQRSSTQATAKVVTEEKKAVPQRQFAFGAVAPPQQFALGQAAPPVMRPFGQSGGSVHGAMRAPAGASPYGGPMANQLQQNAMQQQQQNLNQPNAIQPQRLLQSAENPGVTAADKGGIAGNAPAAATQTVTVDASVAQPAQAQAPPPPALAAQHSKAPVEGKNFELSPAATMQLKKATRIALPNGAPALSVASAAGRTIAIDTMGSLFLREGPGGRWQPVTTQWTGRAVLVRNLQVENEVDALQAKPAARFELMNDKLQMWTSADGRTWTAKPTPTQ